MLRAAPRRPLVRSGPQSGLPPVNPAAAAAEGGPPPTRPSPPLLSPFLQMSPCGTLPQVRCREACVPRGCFGRIARPPH
jgi:hypothetical protein